MVTALLLASMLGTHALVATDDVWIYPHANDQTGDPVLRVWGDGASSVGEMSESAFTYSYSILRFDTSTVTEQPDKLLSAKLVLYHEAQARFTKEESKASPLEARIVNAGFDEKKWSFEQFSGHLPTAGDAALLGMSAAVPSQDGKPFLIEIDLLAGKGDFRKALVGKKAVGIALTTKMAPEGADGTLYEVLSRSANKEHQPRLVLEYGP